MKFPSMEIFKKFLTINKDNTRRKINFGTENSGTVTPIMILCTCLSSSINTIPRENVVILIEFFFDNDTTRKLITIQIDEPVPKCHAHTK